jgi:GTP diphosphokinase / guanosine-3',5'-bis(diphosphate) 3'-diphosphatase
MKQIAKAIVFAAQCHAGQYRKDGKTPYINHPLEVMNLVVTHIDEPKEETIIAAVLHDIVEDTSVTIQEIKHMFGMQVSRLVGELTDDKRLTKEERKRVQLMGVHTLSPEGKLLRLCDKICNVYDILYAPPGDWDIPRRLEYIQWSKDVIDRIRGTHKVLEKRFDELHEAGIRLLK